MNLVFDIGFNRGKFSDACLDKSPNCRIVGVEPNPSLFFSLFFSFSGLSKKAKKICFECHEEETEKMNKIIEHLIDLGYRQFGLIGYFDEGDKFEKLTYSEKGDPYLVEPNKYYSWKDLKEDIDICFQEDRRVNYGMIWAK
jgi:hypothetical protein